MAEFLKRYFEHKGPDLLSNDNMREDSYSSDWLNMEHMDDGGLHKRPGHKPVSYSHGGTGLFTHRKRDNDTSVETQELLNTHLGKLWRAVKLTLTLSYTGAGDEAVVNYWYDPDEFEYRFQIVVDGEEDIPLFDELLGEGTDEGASFPIYSAELLKDDLDATADLTVSLSADGSTTSSAFFFPHIQDHDLVADGELELYTYIWEEVNSPVPNLFSGFSDAKNEDNFEIVHSTAWDALTYFANPYGDWASGIIKYDGQTCYLAGMPKPGTLGLSEVDATGDAEESSITTIGDNTSQGVYTLKINPDSLVINWGSASAETSWVKLYDPAGTVGLYFKETGSNSEAPTGVNRILRFDTDMSGSTTDQDVALIVISTLNGDGNWVASLDASDDTLVIIEDIAGTAAHPQISVERGITLLETSTLSEASHGLDGTYFLLSGASGRRAFWYDNTGSTAEPAHGQSLSSKITIMANDDADTVATATNTVIDALADWASSVVGNVISIVDAADGAREDISAGTTGFSVDVTTQGVNGGLGAGDFNYHATYEQRDAQGIFTEGIPSDNQAVTTSTGTKNVQLIIPTIQPDTGFNTGCAIVDGDQTLVTTIDVVTGHTLKVGDQATLKTIPSDAVAEETEITCTNAAALDGTYFYLYSRLSGSEQTTAFWIDVDNNGTTEPSHGAPASVEITTITAGMTASQVATEVAAAIDGEPDWEAVAVGTVVTVTHAITGPVTDGYDGTTGFAFEVTVEGQQSLPAELITRRVTAITTTSITISGDAVSVEEDSAISNGLTIKIWRTETDGPSITKFLVDQVPNNSFVATITYVDAILDDNLGEEWVEPEFEHGLPPKCRYITTWSKILVVGGNPESPSTIYYSTPFEFSPEYFPADSNLFPLYSNYGDQIRGIYAFQDGVLAFKDRSYFPISGDIYANAIRVDKRTQWDMRFSSHASIIEVGGALFYGDRKGVFAVDLSSAPSEVSQKIRPQVDDNLDATRFLRSVAYFDRQNYRAITSFPAFTLSEGGDVVTDTENSFLIVYSALHNSWYVWDSIDMAGGITEFEDEVFFVRWAENIDGERTHHLMRLSKEDIKWSYQDHTDAIEAFDKSNWYSEGDPARFKSYTFLKTYALGDLSAVQTPHTITSEANLQAGTTHTSVPWTASTQPERMFRLKPRKVRRLRLIFEDSNPNNDMVVTGWEIEGAVADSNDLQE